jgi:SAM-dependent methyltransferase
LPANVVRPPWEEVEAIRSFLHEEGFAAGAHILDVPCGIGRRAVGLAELGYDVTAVDPNEVGIAAAKARAPLSIASRLAFASAPREKLPGLPPDATFDAILCLDHPLGRGPAADDVALLRRLTDHVRPNGLLVLDLLNRDFFASRRRPFAFHTIGGVEQHEFRSFDASTGVLRLEWKFYERVGADLKYRTESAAEFTLLTPRDLAAILDESGWKMRGLWSGWQREPVSADHRKLVVAAKPRRAED